MKSTFPRRVFVLWWSQLKPRKLWLFSWKFSPLRMLPLHKECHGILIPSNAWWVTSPRHLQVQFVFTRCSGNVSGGNFSFVVYGHFVSMTALALLWGHVCISYLLPWIIRALRADLFIHIVIHSCSTVGDAGRERGKNRWELAILVGHEKCLGEGNVSQ